MARLPRLQGVVLIIALLGIALSIVGALTDPQILLRAWLVALVTVIAMPLGCLAMLLVWHLTGGRWGLVLGDALASVVRTLPLLALLFLPLLFELDRIYPWARPDFLAAHETVARKAAFLDPSFFTLRSLVYLAIWTALALILTNSRRPFETRRQRRGTAIIGAMLYALTASFAAIDWVLSLQPDFHSAVFGMLAMSGQAVGGYALALLMTLGMVEAAGRADLLREHRLLGLGSLFLALALLWAYFAFIQYLVIWSGDLPDGADWYLKRAQGVWQALLLTIATLDAGLPFVLLLSARARQSWPVLIGLAAGVLVARVLESLWLTLPAFGAAAPPAWVVAATLAAVGGTWLSAVLWLALPRAGSLVGTLEAAGRG